MIDYLRNIFAAQYEAALCMMNQCVEACQPQHWEGKIANDSFRQVAYHALFFTDLYLSPDEKAFELRELHHRGGDERGPNASIGLDKEETLSYVGICRAKVAQALAKETPESLQAPSGFSWRMHSRGELHVYNIRHLQHHVGQLSAYLRRVDPALKDAKALPWDQLGLAIALSFFALSSRQRKTAPIGEIKNFGIEPTPSCPPISMRPLKSAPQNFP
jgi:hypothetical protein